MTKTTTSNKENTKEFSSNVTIIGSKLIVSLPNAQMPVVWQADLEQAQSSSFTIQEDKKAKSFILISKMQDGTINEIANFSDKQETVDILMNISNTLQNMHIQVNATVKAPSTHETLQSQAKSSSRDNKIGAAIALSLIAILIIIWIISASNNLNTVSESNNDISSASTRSSSGVAVSADDFLNNR